MTGSNVRVQSLPLKEVATYAKGKIPAEELTAATYTLIENVLPNSFGRINVSDPPQGARLDRYEPGDILIASLGLHLQKIWHADHIGGTNNSMLIVRVREEWKDRLRSEFLFRVLSAPNFFEYSARYVVGMRREMNKDKTMNYPILIPPLEVQNTIVRTLGGMQRSISGIHGEYLHRMAGWNRVEQDAIHLFFEELTKKG